MQYSLNCTISPSHCIKSLNDGIFLLMHKFYALEQILVLQAASHTGGLMDNKSIFKDI